MCRSSIWWAWSVAPSAIRAASASTPLGPTARPARWSMSVESISSAGAPGPRLPRAWPRPIAGTSNMSPPSIGAPSPRGDLSPDAELATDHLTHDLSRRSRRGGVVLLSAQMMRVLGQVATLVVLARLLPPSAFGLLAMVAAIGAVLDLVKEFGLSAATIQKQDISHAQVSALFWINAGVGTVLGLGLLLAAPLLARFYGQPELEAVARWLALAFV